jgi:hypothetical protein
MDWRFWRGFRRTASHANAEEMPASVIGADKRASRFSIAETCFGIVVVAGVLYEDWDNLPMVVYPNSPQGRMALGGIIVAFGIVAEIWCSSRSSKAEHEVRDWYALRVAELNLKAKQEHLARVKIEERLTPRRITDSQSENIVAALRAFPQMMLDILVYQSGFEIFGIAIQIDEIATKAGWSVGRIFSEARFAFLGINVAVRAQNDSPDVENAALTLVASLNDNGVAAELAAWDEIPLRELR